MLIASIVAVVSVAAGIGGAALLGVFDNEGGGAPIADSPEEIAGLSKDRLTQADVTKINGDALFWAMFRKQATQPVAHAKRLTYRDLDDFEAGMPDGIEESAHDYRSKQFSHTALSLRDGKVPDHLTRCVDGASYYVFLTLSEDRQDWDSISKSDQTCERTYSPGRYSDGVNINGLTDEQADAFVGYLRDGAAKGLMRPGKPALAEHDGKQYVRLPVELKPVKMDGHYWGGQVLIFALHEIGFDGKSIGEHPYAYYGRGGGGFEITYLIDPKSLLPVYGEFRETPGMNEETDRPDPMNTGDLSAYRIHYIWHGKVPKLNLKGKKPLTFSWPDEES
ncbi:hypothetical protein [Nonomuraea aridisoli]|uniref:Uncharacterized protein n=1 Tax=Nonomuraea aridisoli TaxID=2070368 RepID=A0A2W2FHP8_9ACTN|nr:hypothetical protein [Nonomuraea aridisoli]PZG21217.1 hypothetical protein C1J01_07100 [Nonomuraea aridisoli]